MNAVEEFLKDVTELVQLRVRVDAVEEQLKALQVETETQKTEIQALQAAVNKPEPA